MPSSAFEICSFINYGTLDQDQHFLDHNEVQNDIFRVYVMIYFKGTKMHTYILSRNTFNNV